MVAKTSTKRVGYAEQLKGVLFIPEKRGGEERWRNGTPYSIPVTTIRIIFYPGFMRLFILSEVFFFYHSDGGQTAMEHYSKAVKRNKTM